MTYLINHSLILLFDDVLAAKLKTNERMKYVIIEDNYFSSNEKIGYMVR